MALVVADRVQETTSTTGTSDYVLIGAATGYQSFGSVMANADTTYYAITNDTDWEVGVGTYSTTGPTLARTTILASSNGGSAVNWGAGVKNIFISYAASKSVYLDGNGDLLVSDKIVHAGDTDTAIRFPAANTMSVETGGTERFKVENSTITTTVPVLLPADPTLPLQAATKEYVDTIASAGIHYHAPVRVEAPLNLNATYNNGTSGVGATLTNAGTQVALVIDGVTVATNDRVLVYEQTNQTQNGVYTVTNTGSVSTNWVLTRSTDTDSYGPSDPDALGAGDAFFVQQGNTGAGELYVCNTEGTITFGTTNITFTQIAATAVYTAGTAISVTNNVITNTAPDQTVALTQSGATSISGTYPNFTISSTDTTYSAGNGIGLAGTTFSVAAGSGLTQDASGLSHADTSSQSSVDNSGATFIQDINLDGFGHVTGAASVTVTPSLIGAPQNDGTGATGTWGISISGNANNVSGTVSVSNGGTGATTVGQARTNLDVPTRSGGDASGTWSIDISGNAATATTTDQIDGVGFRNTGSNSAVNADTLDSNGITYYTAGVPNFTGNATDGALYSQAYSSSWQHQIAADYRSGQIALRGKNSGTWQSWRTVLDSSNYTSYAPSLTGSGASGTWGINVTGNAATVTNGVYTNSSAAISGDNHITFGPNSSWGSSLRVGGNGRTATGTEMASVVTTDGNLHLDPAASANATYLNYYAGTGGVAFGNGSSGIVAWMGPDGDLWKGGGDNSGTQYVQNSGTWGINVTGSAGSVAWGNVSSKPSNIMYYQSFTLDANTMDSNSTGFTYSVNAPYTGPVARFSTGGSYDLWLNATYGGGNDLAFRTRNGDNATLNPWRAIIHNGNYTSYTAARNGSGYLIPDNWIQLNGTYGLYSTTNNAHFYPNDGSYGSWKVIGTRNGWAGLEFQDSNTSLMMNTEAYGIHRNGVGWRFYLENANGYFPGNVTAYWSDARLKENLREIKGEALEILGSFTAYRFNWNEKVEEIGATIPVGKEEIGLIAQQVQAALPDAVCVNKAGAPIDGAEFDYLTINYDRITPLLVEGVNIHEKELASLRERVQRLEALVDRLTGGVAGDSGGA